MLTLEDLRPYFRTVVHTTDPSYTIGRARSLFLLYGIGSVPVVRGRRPELVGLLRLRDVYEWEQGGGSLEEPISKLRGHYEAARSKVDLVDAELDLFEAMRRLEHCSRLFIRGADGQIEGIVSPRAAQLYLRGFAAPLLRIRRVELRLRAHIEHLLEEAELEQLRHNGRVRAGTWGEIQLALGSHWSRFPFHGHDSKQAMALVNNTRELRNALVHFERAEPTRGELDDLKALERLLGVAL